MEIGAIKGKGKHKGKDGGKNAKGKHGKDKSKSKGKDHPTNQGKLKVSGYCSRCGRAGHVARDCYSVKTRDGADIHDTYHPPNQQQQAAIMGPPEAQPGQAASPKVAAVSSGWLFALSNPEDLPSAPAEAQLAGIKRPR
eukprot:753726-Alexandrium_andersonii.AAC.1